MEFPAPNEPDGQRISIGFRPHAVQISNDLLRVSVSGGIAAHHFLGIMLRLELEFRQGLTLRSRITKEGVCPIGIGGWKGGYLFKFDNIACWHERMPFCLRSCRPFTNHRRPLPRIFKLKEHANKGRPLNLDCNQSQSFACSP